MFKLLNYCETVHKQKTTRQCLDKHTTQQVNLRNH
jgi:hypothetical protein